MNTEEKLAQALHTIADRAEDLDVLPGVVAKRRRRARRRTRATIAAACAVILGWGALVAWPEPRLEVETAEPKGDSVEQVWPEAVFTMPGRNKPLAAISATEVLTWNERGSLDVYDAGSRRSHTIAAFKPKPRHVAVDRDRVVWLAGGQAWVAPLRTGGKARKVGPVAGEDVDRVGLAGEYVVWSAPLDGVWRMRIAGGAPERVAKSKGLQLVEWPWATDEPLDISANPTKVVNLQTGRTVRIRPLPGVGRLRCGPTWCMGRREDGAMVQRSDGGWSQEHQGIPTYPYQDRFVVGRMMIYDARSGTTATFTGTPAGGPGGWMWSTGVGVIYWELGGKVRVVNLAAVP